MNSTIAYNEDIHHKKWEDFYFEKLVEEINKKLALKLIAYFRQTLMRIPQGSSLEALSLSA